MGWGGDSEGQTVANSCTRPFELAKTYRSGLKGQTSMLFWYRGLSLMSKKGKPGDFL